MRREPALQQMLAVRNLLLQAYRPPLLSDKKAQHEKREEKHDQSKSCNALR